MHPKRLGRVRHQDRRAEAEGSAGAPADAAVDPPVAVELVSADPAKGEALVKGQGCVACHSFNEGGKAGVGPNLYGVVGAPHGHMAGYEYSAALKGKQGPWTYDELYEWLKKPAAYAPGTKMSYAGLADPAKRADIIDYLRSLSHSPEALPAVPRGRGCFGRAGHSDGGQRRRRRRPVARHLRPSRSRRAWCRPTRLPARRTR